MPRPRQLLMVLMVHRLRKSEPFGKLTTTLCSGTLGHHSMRSLWNLDQDLPRASPSRCNGYTTAKKRAKEIGQVGTALSVRCACYEYRLASSGGVDKSSPNKHHPLCLPPVLLRSPPHLRNGVGWIRTRCMRLVRDASLAVRTLHPKASRRIMIVVIDTA